MFLLPLEEIGRARPLFRKMDMHLALQAILAGQVEAPIYVDDVEHPHFALTWAMSRVYLAGKPGNRAAAEALRKVFNGILMREALKAGHDAYMLSYPDASWEPFIALALQEREPIQMGRQYYAFKEARANWHTMLPAGMQVRAVDAALLAEKWHNPEYLTEEMVSERPSVEDFLAKSFGVCLTRDDEILGWCLSEYNTHHRCEVGIATRGDVRKRGLGTMLALAFVEMAEARGVARVGWHCSANNAASGATALRAGFEHVADYPAYLGWFDPALNTAQRGYFALVNDNFADALNHYEKALSMSEAPDWAYFGAGCAAAMLGQTERALAHLTNVVEHGAEDSDDFRESKFLTSLRENLAFNLLLEKLDKRDKGK